MNINKFLKISVLVCGSIVTAQTKSNISVDTKQPSSIISKHIYGHFAEHLGRGIYDGIYVGENSKIPNSNGVRNQEDSNEN